jgi:transcriptional regulator with XRE-family HTH domain
MEDKRDQHDIALGQALRQLRKGAGLTQKQLAEVADVPVVELRLIERGEVDADWGTIRHLANGIKVTLVEVFLLMEDLQGD